MKDFHERIKEIDDHFANISIEEFEQNLIDCGLGQITPLLDEDWDFIDEDLDYINEVINNVDKKSDNNYLLTYWDMNKNGLPTFAWFETEEKMDEFIEEKGSTIHIINELHLIEFEDLDYCDL